MLNTALKLLVYLSQQNIVLQYMSIFTDNNRLLGMKNMTVCITIFKNSRNRN